MLSEGEARALALIEQQLVAEDPRLAARLSGASPGRLAAWLLSVRNLVIVVVLVAAVVCFVVGAVGAGLAAGLFAGVVLWARRLLAC